MQGRLDAHLAGKSELGEAEFEIEPYRILGIKMIEFQHAPKDSFNQGAWGDRTIEVTRRDGITMVIRGAAFSRMKTNRNGCWIGDEPVFEAEFMTNGLTIDVPWKEISTIRGPEELRGGLTLISPSGSEAKGAFTNSEKVRGVMEVFPQYNLWVEFLPSSANYPQLFTKLEFR